MFNYSKALPALTALDDRPIVLWTDSIGNGTGADDLLTTGRSVLARLFTPSRYVINCGVGGEPPGPIADRFVSEAFRYATLDPIHIVHFGRPDYAQPATNFTMHASRCMDAATSDKILLCVPQPGASATEMTQNGVNPQALADARQELMETYPEHYLDHMKAIWDTITGADTVDDQNAVPNFVASTTPEFSQIVMGTADPNDGRGYMPPKYLVGGGDNIHNNAAGQAIWAQAFHDAIIARGW